MGSKLLTLFSFHILHLLLFFCGAKADSDPSTELICKLVNCGFGTCKASNTLLPPFDCDCSPGWKKLQIGSITLPPCIIPNCTMDLNCGAPPPPPPPILPNISDPCSYTSCGDGTCVKSETELSGYICQCNEGSANLMNRSGLICIKKCSVGTDCTNLDLGPLYPLPPPPPPPPVTSEAPTLIEDGGGKVDGNFATDRPVLTTLLLLATLIPWI